MRPVVQHLREVGFRILPYVDDFGGAPPAEPGVAATKEPAVAAYQFVERLFGELGLRMHPTKGTKDGPTYVRLLGHLVDTKMDRFLPPPDHIDKIVALAVGLSRRASEHRRSVNFAALRRFCGTAVSTKLSVPSARYHLRSLFTAMQHRRLRRGDVQLGRHALKDLRWWTDLQDNAATGRPLWPGASTILMDTDASCVGWGAILNQSAEARGCHGIDRNGLDINCLELGAVTRALLSFRHLIPAGAIIRLRTDTMVALGVLRAGSSRSPILMDEMRDLYEFCTDMHVELRMEHVSSALNEWADRLSREHNTTDWTLRAATFSALDAKYGPHSFDLFASKQSARCSRFYARWMCPGALASDAFQQDWAAETRGRTRASTSSAPWSAGRSAPTPQSPSSRRSGGRSSCGGGPSTAAPGGASCRRPTACSPTPRGRCRRRCLSGGLRSSGSGQSALDQRRAAVGGPSQQEGRPAHGRPA